MLNLSINQADSFMLYPTQTVTTVLRTREDVELALERLQGTGVNPEDVKILYGEPGRHILDANGEESGIMGKFLRTLEKISEVQHTYVEYVDSQLKQGHYALAIPISSKEHRKEVEGIVKALNTTFAVYFGKGSIVDIVVPLHVAVR